MDMNLQKYRSFVKTAECGSFTKAAEYLNYSQSSISRMIRDLENEWKVVLLDRSVGGVNLTSDGKKLLPYAKTIVEDFEKLQTEVDDLNGLQSGLIRIGTFTSAATHWLPHIIKEFQKRYPNIVFELIVGDYAEIEEWIVEGRVDCGFLKLPAHPELETIFMNQDKLLAVIPEDHPLAASDRFPIAELCTEPFILREKDSKAEITEIFERCGLTPRVQITTWDDYAVMSMVESHLGVSILPELVLRRNPYHILTRELDVPAFREIGFALRSKKTASLSVKRFLEYLEYRDQ